MSIEASTELFLGRQPIMDASGNLVAFELLFRSGHANGAVIDDDVAATATVINHVFSELGVDAVLGGYAGFINLSAGLILSDVIELLPSDRVVLELLETVQITPAVLSRLRELRARGFQIALDDYAGNETLYADTLDLVDIVKVDVQGMSAPELETVTGRLKRWPVRLLAEKVDAKDQVQHCAELGYELFQGYYFARPSVITGRRLSHAHGAIMRLTGLVAQDAESAQIEQVFKENPDLSINLLRLVNSAAMGTRRRVHSLQDAIILLGRNQLQRWLQLMMFSAEGGSKGRFPSPLLLIAATRGRLMELLFDAAFGRNRGRGGDEAFLAGITSLMGALLGMSLEEVFKGLPVPDSVRLAVLERSGAVGRLLSLAEGLEHADVDTIQAELIHLPRLDAARVNDIHVAAMEWAHAIGRPGHH